MKKLFRSSHYRFAPDTRWYNIRFWDPVIGCTPVSAGCLNCSSAATVRRNSIDSEVVRASGANARWTGQVKIVDGSLDLVSEFAPNEQIFVAGRSDLFHEKISDSYRDRIIECAHERPDCTFLALTKRPERIGKRVFPKNFWVGISVEDQQTAALRLPYLRDVTATKIVSAKPLLGPVCLREYVELFDMVAVGGEHGSNARPAHPDWVRSIRDQCVAAGKPFSFHNWGRWLPGSGPVTRYIDYDGKFCPTGEPVHIHEQDEDGTSLDGVVWDQYPCQEDAQPF